VFVRELYAAAALLLVALGLYCIASKRNLIKTIIGIELVTLGVNLSIMSNGLRIVEETLAVDALAQSMTIVSIAIGASVAALALALAVNIYRHYGTLDTSKLRKLRW